MDNRKFEKLIDLIINEQEEQARELFHDIVVEKSREIYEGIMDEEMEGESMGGQVGEMMDEISADEAGGMTEDDSEEEALDDLEGHDDMDDGEVIDIDADDESEIDQHEEVEDAVVRIEDKLDQLMAEFEEIMGKGDEEGNEDFGGEEGEEGGEEGLEDFSDEEGEESPEEVSENEDDDEEMVDEDVMEAVQLQKVSVTHGDDGANKKSPTLTKPKVVQTGANPVKFSGASESVPTSPKSASNPYTKGQGDLPNAGKFKNAPGQKGQDLDKAPAPKKGDDGSNTKSPLGESKKVVKKIIKK